MGIPAAAPAAGQTSCQALAKLELIVSEFIQNESK